MNTLLLTPRWAQGQHRLGHVAQRRSTCAASFPTRPWPAQRQTLPRQPPSPGVTLRSSSNAARDGLRHLHWRRLSSTGRVGIPFFVTLWINCFCQGPVLKARAKSPNALAQDGRGAGNCKSPYGVRHPGASGAFHSDGRLAGRQLFSLLQARVQGAPLRVSHLHRPASRVSDGALAPGFANNPFAADVTGTWTAQLTLPPQSCPCSAAATTGTCSCPHYRAAECGTASESSEMADGTRVTGGTRSVC